LHNDLHKYDKALSKLRHALKIKQNITLYADEDRKISVTLHEIGRSQMNLCNYRDVLANLNRTLEIEKIK